MISNTQEPTLNAVRCLVLYSLAEFQLGHASAIRITVEGTAFAVADDGRGHAIDRVVAESPYLKFIYTHLDFPFEQNRGAPVQLQGIGMSLLNTLCSELKVEVRKPEATLQLAFREGQFISSQRLEQKSSETGNTVAGTIHPKLQAAGVNLSELRQWLLSVNSAFPSLKLFLNSHELQAG